MSKWMISGWIETKSRKDSLTSHKGAFTIYGLRAEIEALFIVETDKRRDVENLYKALVKESQAYITYITILNKRHHIVRHFGSVDAVPLGQYRAHLDGYNVIIDYDSVKATELPLDFAI